MIRADKRKYHFIYKTTCLITNRYYIGMHSTNNVEDGYIGSGKRLWRSVNKHGKENHVCEILEFLPSRKELAEREKEIVNEELLGDSQCMNLSIGGNGSFSHLNNSSPEHIQRTKKGWQKAVENGLLVFSKERKKKCSENAIKNCARASNPFKNKEIQKEMQLRARTPKALEKRKESFKKCDHQQGSNNSQFGTCWIYHDLIGNKKCSKELLPEYIEQGWIKGRKRIELSPIYEYTDHLLPELRNIPVPVYLPELPEFL